MKKRLVAALLVALLASSMVFAGFSGNATVKAFYDLDTKDYGFANGQTVNFELELAKELAEKKGEGDIYASIKATLNFSIIDVDADGVGAGDPISPANFITKSIATIDEAKVAGENWYVSILGVASRLDLAKSAIDTWTVKNELDDYGRLKADYTKNASYAVANKKAPGVEIGYEGYSLSVGGIHREVAKAGEYKAGTDFTLNAATPDLALAEGLTLKAGLAFNQVKTKLAAADNSPRTIGASGKVAFEKDELAVSVAGDFGYDIEGKKANFDVAANAKYDFVTVDAYFAKDVKVNTVAKKDLLSAKAVFDLKSFDLPLTLTVKGKDLINKNSQDLSASVAYKADEYAAEVGGGYAFANKEWNAYLKGNADVSIFNVYAGAKVSKAQGADLALKPFVGAKTTSLIPGATLTAQWIGDDFDVDVLAKKYGKIEAICKIAF